MLTLYYRPTCPFCRRVLAVIDRLALDVELLDVTDTEIADQLLKVGGKSQVPFLIDTKAGIEIYESDAIVSHLQNSYGGVSTATVKPRIHIADNVCVACEG
ncbi:MAG TPA: glutathione S-transferase N-terminal domain-containing protein [Candidatus Paceibacterota bacterium]|nr:glutathione S-transferase N-terminal domain-containing protein [Candidatus Paceibacterota bacterium]HMO83104.1 glutathione S-transferase N-terminal domain-containing protein [Candidatus Paceibacterota bacterium]